MTETKKRMTKQEKEEWNNLYEYVRSNVLGYDSNQSLSRHTVLRLKGLTTNKFMENSNIKDGANYSYGVILNTFKFCNADIQRGLATITFNDERHKLNYIIKIVESNINTVYNRMKNATKSKQKTESMNVVNITHKGADYKKRTEKTSSRLKDLW